MPEALRQRADADVPASAVPVGGVHADVDRFVVVGEGPAPPADGDDVIAVESDRVDVAADPLRASRLFMRTLAWPSGLASTLRYSR